MTLLRRPTAVIVRMALCAASCAGPVAAQSANEPQLTIYRSDSSALYASSGSGSLPEGYAVVHEQRALALVTGVHDVTINGLPANLDPEALALDFPAGQANVLAQRLLTAHGRYAELNGWIGQPVDVLSNSGQSLASGTLLRVTDGILIRDGSGHTTLVNNYAAVRSQADGAPAGSSLSVQVDATRSGTSTAKLSYPTSGLGWRAAYVGTLQPGDSCRMQFQSRASIANRSGRDWHDAHIALIAGTPNFAKTSGPRPMMLMSARAVAAPAPSSSLPQQSALDDYRSYALPSAVDLPDGSISEAPLYAGRTVDCERTALYETGGNWSPDRPMLVRSFNDDGGHAIVSSLTFHAFDSLPAGYLRVLANDATGTPQFIGEDRIQDTPKGGGVTITLGTAFDLRAERTRTQFHVDETAHTLDEAFSLSLSNAGNSTRQVTVREHPNRWHQWTLVSSDLRPNTKTTDTLAFNVSVPAHGRATLDYAVRYQWTAADQTQ